MNTAKPRPAGASRRLAPIALLMLSACASGANYRAPAAAELGATDTFQSRAQAGDVVDLVTWWSGFSDPMLTAIIERAVAENLDIAQASARLDQARASLAQSRAGLWPSLSGSNGVSRSEVDGGPASTGYAAELDARWTIDLFGGLRRDREAARAMWEAAGYSLQSVRIAVAAEVARNYVDYRTLMQRIAVAEETLARQSENLEIATFRNRAGLVSSLDVEQARAQRAATAATIPTLDRAAAGARFRLAVLCGEPPGALDRELNGANGSFAPPPVPGAGLPTDLLRRRPDVLSTERGYAAAVARVGVAKAQLYPSLSLAGTIGSTSATLDGVGDVWARTLTASMLQPMFEGGRLRAVVRQRQAAAVEAYLAYRAAVLGAIEDVENALTAQGAADARLVALAEQAQAARAATLLARVNYRAGLVDFQTLLDAERTLLAARDALAAAEADQANAVIQLYLALGGGWSPAIATP